MVVDKGVVSIGAVVIVGSVMVDRGVVVDEALLAVEWAGELALARPFDKSSNIVDAISSKSLPNSGKTSTSKEGTAESVSARVLGRCVPRTSKSDRTRDPSLETRVGISAIVSVGSEPEGSPAVEISTTRVSITARSAEKIAGRSDTAPVGSASPSKVASWLARAAPRFR